MEKIRLWLRDNPVKTTFIFFIAGLVIYSLMFIINEVWFVDHLLDGIGNNKTLCKKFISSVEATPKGIYSQIMNNKSLIIPIILAPYFWLLWIWRHNDKENAKRREVKVDNEAEFYRAADKIISHLDYVRELGIGELETILINFESNSLVYERFSNQAIYYILHSRNYGECSENGKVLYLSPVALSTVLSLQIKHMKITKKVSDYPIKMNIIDPYHLKGYRSTGKKGGMELALVNCQTNISYFSYLFDNHLSNQFPLSFPITFNSGKLLLINPTFVIDTQFAKFIDYFSDSNYVVNPTFEIIDISPISLVGLKKIKESNSTFSQDISTLKYRQNGEDSSDIIL